jgi:hypothetical protein
MRKNYPLFVLFLLFITSCSKEKLVKSNPETVDGKAVVHAGGDERYDLLGYGYDMTGDFLENRNASDAPVIDMERFVRENPTRIDTPTSSEGDDKVYAGSTAYDYLKEVTKKSKVSAGVDVLGGADLKRTLFSGIFTGKSEYESKYSFSSKYAFASCDTRVQLKRIRTTQDATINDLIQYLTPDFINNMNTQDAASLVRRYGTHVLLDISIGGRLNFSYKTEFRKEFNSEQRTKSVEAGMKLALSKIVGLNFSTEMSKSEMESWSRENSNIDFTVRYRGGTTSPTTISLSPDGTTLTTSIAEWSSSINLRNAALVGIDRAIPLSEFITDPAKKSQVQAAILEYIASKQINVMELRTLYRMHSDRAGNTFYVFSEDEAAQYYQYGDKLLGIDGHILKNAEPGTRPLYRMHSNRAGNTFYVFSQAEVDEYRTRYGDEYRGIDGYILNNATNDTRPLYRMHSNRSGNTFYVFSQGEANEYFKYGDQLIGIDGYIYK